MITQRNLQIWTILCKWEPRLCLPWSYAGPGQNSESAILSPPALTLFCWDPQHFLHSQRVRLFTKPHFLIPPSSTSVAEQWHLVQYFIKSCWNLTVQSIRKLQTLSNINYLEGCGGAHSTGHLLGRHLQPGVSAHSRCVQHNLYKPPPDGKHCNWRKEKTRTP